MIVSTLVNGPSIYSRPASGSDHKLWPVNFEGMRGTPCESTFIFGTGGGRGTADVYCDGTREVGLREWISFSGHSYSTATCILVQRRATRFLATQEQATYHHGVWLQGVWFWDRGTSGNLPPDNRDQTFRVSQWI